MCNSADERVVQSHVFVTIKEGKLLEALAAFTAGVVAAEKGADLGICLANRSVLNTNFS